MRYRHVFAYMFAASIFATSFAVAQTRETSAPEVTSDVEQPGDNSYPESVPSGNQSVPRLLNLPAGTLITVRTTQPLSSDHNRPGDSFTTVLDQSIVARGWVVVRRGQVVMGRVVTAQKAGHGNASSQLAVELSDLTLVDGQPISIRTELAQVSGGNPSRSRNEGAIVGATTGTGAVIGAIAGGGPGVAIGAAVGAAAGVAGVLSTRDKATELESETLLTFRLQNPVDISTEGSRQAFLPVTPSDYNRGPARNPDRYPEARNYPNEPRRHFTPYDNGWYMPPYNYLGFYGYWGPRYYYPTPRVYVAPSFRRHYR